MNAPAGIEGADIKARVDAAVDSGMCMAVWAELQPDKMAVLEVSGRSRTFGELNAKANRLVKLMRAHGLEAGDAVAIVSSTMPIVASNCAMISAAVLENPVASRSRRDGTNAPGGGTHPPSAQGRTSAATRTTLESH